VVEATLSVATRGPAILAIAILMIALLGGLALTGKRPGLPELRFEGHGIISTSPSAIVRAEIRMGRNRIAFGRSKLGSWGLARANGEEIPGEVASHLDAALQFMHVSEPTRTLDPGDYQGESFADFGLSPPLFLVLLTEANQTTMVTDFGALNPTSTSQYARIVGQSNLYLMPRHVGAEWQLTADIAQRALPVDNEGNDEATLAARHSAKLLLPVSLEQIWAIEVVFEGKLHRLERDGNGNWFLHVGQHTHSGNSPGHVADPTQAKIIANALEAFDQTQIESLAVRHAGPEQIERYGLSRPVIIALVYARDSSSPLARIEIGNMAADAFGRYVRLAATGDVVTIAAYESERLIELLKAIGAVS
jgi:hypothetical protein